MKYYKTLLHLLYIKTETSMLGRRKQVYGARNEYIFESRNPLVEGLKIALKRKIERCWLQNSMRSSVVVLLRSFPAIAMRIPTVHNFSRDLVRAHSTSSYFKEK